jgi:glyoxylase-like metal-dependent hydrolase (beta-lactamase superfamily II)
MADLLELTEHISLIKLMNATRTNIYVVREPDGDTLVDPGPVGTAQAILALDRRGEIRLRRVIVTHAHPAHAGSVARVVRGTGVRVWVHPLDAQFLDGRSPPLLPTGRRGQLMAALGRVVELQPTVFRLEPLTIGAPVGSLVPIATPGHTPGHVCLWHAGDRALLSGDALVVDGGQPAQPAASLSADPTRARSSLAALRELDFAHLLPGHGTPLLGGARERVLGYLDRLTASGPPPA